MEPIRLPDDKEIRATYYLSEEAVIELIPSNSLGTLMTLVQTLEEQDSKNSRNNGKPPTSDGLAKLAPKNLLKRHGKKSGGLPGHEGHALKAVRLPEYIRVYLVHVCKHCQESLEKMEMHDLGKRQVFDLPPRRV